MNTLYTFGCSFTEGFNENHELYQEYKVFKGGTFPKTWPELLSEKLGFNLFNYGIGGTGNQHIFTNFCKHVNQFKKGDIVIIGWTFMERFRMSNVNGTGWNHFGPSSKKETNIELISNDCLDMLFINRTLKPYYDEIYDYEKIIDKLSKEMGFEIYYWTIINELIYNQDKDILNQKKYLLNKMIKDEYHNTFRVIFDNGGMRIFEETDGLVNDSHMGESGHKIQADLFYNHILNTFP
jgi:hypothetical protein